MDALIAITERAGQPTVNARELHAFLEVGKVFAAWITERITAFDFKPGADFEVVSESGNNPQGGRPAREYFLSLDMAKELSMLERNQRGKEARLYFIECERRAKAAALPDLSDPASLRTLLLGYTEKVLALEATVAEQAPKAEFFDAVAVADSAQPVAEVAKVLGIGEKKLRDFLRKTGIFMQRAPLPMQDQIDAGRFKVIERTFDDGRGFQKNYAKTLVTGRGLQYLQKKLADAGMYGGH